MLYVKHVLFIHLLLKLTLVSGTSLKDGHFCKSCPFTIFLWGEGSGTLQNPVVTLWRVYLQNDRQHWPLEVSQSFVSMFFLWLFIPWSSCFTMFIIMCVQEGWDGTNHKRSKNKAAKGFHTDDKKMNNIAHKPWLFTDSVIRLLLMPELFSNLF